MSAPLLVAALVIMGLVIFWYVQDEITRGGQGKSGLLGMSDEASASQRPSRNSGWKRSTGNRPWRVRRH